MFDINEQNLKPHIVGKLRLFESNYSMIKQVLSLRNNRILVTDDEEFCLASMRNILEKCGVDILNQVDFCIDGQEAFDQLVDAYNSGMTYKLVLTDFSMPVKDGIEATKEMRKFLTNQLKLPRSEQPQIIGTTGHIEEQFRQQGLNAGMDEVLAKPIYVDKL